VSEDGGIRVTARQRPQKGDGGSGILGAEKASVRGALRVRSSEAGDSRIATLTPLPPYPREWMGRRAASDGDEDACRLEPWPHECPSRLRTSVKPRCNEPCRTEARHLMMDADIMTPSSERYSAYLVR
jgi:hypothetical protein